LSFGKWYRILKILVAGASGAIGRPLISELIKNGHTVFGMARSKDSAEKIRALGAIPFYADALDEESVFKVMQEISPEVVIEMLTSLPKEYTPQSNGRNSCT